MQALYQKAGGEVSGDSAPSSGLEGISRAPQNVLGSLAGGPSGNISPWLAECLQTLFCVHVKSLWKKHTSRFYLVTIRISINDF